jgi:hypothetical protein
LTGYVNLTDTIAVNPANRLSANNRHSRVLSIALGVVLLHVIVAFMWRDLIIEPEAEPDAQATEHLTKVLILPPEPVMQAPAPVAPRRQVAKSNQKARPSGTAPDSMPRGSLPTGAATGDSASVSPVVADEPPAVGNPEAVVLAGSSETAQGGQAAPAPESQARDGLPRVWAAVLPEPVSVQLSYKVFYGDSTDAAPIARLQFRMAVSEGKYSMSTEARAEGVMAWVYSGVATQISEGVTGPDGLEPLLFNEQRGKRGPRVATVDRASGLVRFGARGAQAAWQPGIQDRLSTLIQLGLVLQAVPALQDPGQVVSFPEMTSSGVARATYRNAGLETLELPGAAPMNAIKLVRIATSADEPGIEVWLGLNQQWMPVRIKVTSRSRGTLDQWIEL